VAKVIERIEAHYETQDMEMGKVYRWCPERVVVECNCGKRATLSTSSVPTCSRCGEDHADIVGEVLEEEPALSPEPSDRCKHRLMGIVPIVAVRVEGGYASRCLLCGALGPVMRNGETSRRLLLTGYHHEQADLGKS
jgi:hypothetical protein